MFRIFFFIKDALICDKILYPELHEIVTTCMVHNHGERCRQEDGSCSYGYPKPFCAMTMIRDDGLPQYRRRNDGRSFTNSRGEIFTNRDIVPYNPFLLQKYKAHLNVEHVNSNRSIKYLFK